MASVDVGVDVSDAREAEQPGGEALHKLGKGRGQGQRLSEEGGRREKPDFDAKLENKNTNPNWVIYILSN